jgi:predicted RNase H-like nuclease (RuvC/YqgF family)
MSRSCVRVLRVLAVPGALVLTMSATSAQVVVPKPRIASLIVNVENGVDQFRKWADNRADRAKDNAEKAPKGGQARRGATETQKDRAKATKDELDDTLDELNRSTNRLRRKFDATDAWIETKVEVERVVDDARKINQALTRGKYGTEADRLWAVLRSAINDLAVPYGVARLGV